MKAHGLIASLGWMVVGILFCIGSLGYGLGSAKEPGPGFFPFWMSVCLISFSTIHIVSSLRQKGQFSLRSKKFWPGSGGTKRILLTTAFLFIYVVILNHLGFVLTTLLFMVVVLKFIEPQKWSTIIFITSLATGLSYAIFQLWLKANLPTGIFGF